MLFLKISFRFAWNDISRNKGEVFKIEALNLIDQVGWSYTHNKLLFSNFESRSSFQCKGVLKAQSNIRWNYFRKFSC